MASNKQVYVWLHNSLIGRTSQAYAQMQAVIQARSTTHEAKVLATKIASDIQTLNALLQTRVELDGTSVKMRRK